MYILLYFLGKPALQNSQEKEKEKSVLLNFSVKCLHFAKIKIHLIH